MVGLAVRISKMELILPTHTTRWLDGCCLRRFFYLFNKNFCFYFSWLFLIYFLANGGDIFICFCNFTNPFITAAALKFLLLSLCLQEAETTNSLQEEEFVFQTAVLCFSLQFCFVVYFVCSVWLVISNSVANYLGGTRFEGKLKSERIFTIARPFLFIIYCPIYIVLALWLH